MYWNNLIDENELASLLPGPYRCFARPVKQALTFFLDDLPEKRQRQLLAHQADLGPLATLSQRLGRLARDCPVIHKLSQTLARDARLAPELREQLRPLESLPSVVPTATIERELQKELGPLARRGVTLGKQALAEASVAVVAPFVDGSKSAPRHGVFKLLKPGIAERLEQELELLSKVGARLDQCCHRLRIPQIDYELTFSQVREKLTWEVRLEREQKHLVAAKTFFADEPNVLIPELFEHCSPRVTSMERVIGTTIFDIPAHCPVSKRTVAKQIVRALVSHPFFSLEREALFHADPHAGNLMLAEDGRLAILDWSLAGSLGAEARGAMVQLLLAAITFNGDRISKVVHELGMNDGLDAAALAQIIARRLQGLCRGEIPGLAWMVGLFDEAVCKAGVRLPAELMLFRKSLHALDGLVSELSAGDVRLDDVLIIDFARAFAADWPHRFFQGAASRNLRTRISNADLAKLALSTPSAFTRWLSLNNPFTSIQPVRSQLGAPAAAGAP
jgi:ubiquinone biosynthesis protein